VLGEAARSAGYRLIVRDEVASTMEEARVALAQGDPGKLWIVARSQKAGRGRHGRQWGSRACCWSRRASLCSRRSSASSPGWPCTMPLLR
jgi:biotin-(acetyl-CoA carboxylase) ligase